MLQESYLNNKAVTHKEKNFSMDLFSIFQEQRYIYLKGITQQWFYQNIFNRAEIQGHPQKNQTKRKPEI